MINGEDSANSVDEIKKIGGRDVTAESPADEEQTVWKAGRHEWLIMGCLTIVTLIVVSRRLHHRIRPFLNSHIGNRRNHSSSSVTSEFNNEGHTHASLTEEGYS